MVLTIIIAIIIFVHIFFLWAFAKKNFAVIDIGWGLGCLLAVVVAYLHNDSSTKNLLLLGAVVIWGLRLASYILIRSWGKGEDPRYTKFREEWKPHSNLQAYFKVFLFQGVLMGVVTLPATVGMSQNSEMTLINYIGVLIWILGFSLEVYADYYLNWWKSVPSHKGQICKTGPWTLCRFPNYFGEVLLWYGVFLIGFSLSSSWSIIGAIVINLLILKVTGVPLLEEKYLKRQDYREYSSKVPRFIPFTKP